jgi:hypothetical protein
MKTLENATPVSVPEKPDSSNHSKTSNGLPVIPDGWALVPVEMTKAMKEAVRENGGEQAMLYALAAWNDLLPAAPKPPLRTEAAVRAEARREALEEAAMAAENVYVVIDKDEYGETRKHGSGMDAAVTIRALIDRP